MTRKVRVHVPRRSGKKLIHAQEIGMKLINWAENPVGKAYEVLLVSNAGYFRITIKRDE